MKHRLVRLALAASAIGAAIATTAPASFAH